MIVFANCILLNFINKYCTCINFALKSLIILDIEEPLSNWDEIIETNFPNSVYSSNVMSDPMESRRNQAWDLLSESYEVSIDMFLSLHKEFEDEKSLYK